MAQGPSRGRPDAEEGREGRGPGEEEALAEEEGPEEGLSPAAPDLRIGPLGHAEERAAAGLLARAFRDEPLDRAVIGGGPARRLRACRAGMSATLVAARGRADLRGAWLGERLAGALLALPAGLHPLPPPPVGVQLRTLWRQGLGVARRWREVWERLEAHRPVAPHAHLSLVGVEPGLQGRGLGSALLAGWLADVDRAGERAWVETAREANVRLYERFGFSVREELTLRGVPVWLMARPPRREV